MLFILVFQVSLLYLTILVGVCFLRPIYVKFLRRLFDCLITDNTRISITACDTVPRFFNRTMLGFAIAVTEESKINMPITLL